MYHEQATVVTNSGVANSGVANSGVANSGVGCWQQRSTATPLSGHDTAASGREPSAGAGKSRRNGEHGRAHNIEEAVDLTQSLVMDCFNRAFGREFALRMVGGAAEPAYLPHRRGRQAVIYCREDFAPSALHEAAHWLLATPAQREREDYGHVYVMPPRTIQQQATFYAAELSVQALECWLSQRAGIRFNASADDPSSSLARLQAFQTVVRQIAAWYNTGVGGVFVPTLAHRLASALSNGTAGTRRWQESLLG